VLLLRNKDQQYSNPLTSR